MNDYYKKTQKFIDEYNRWFMRRTKRNLELVKHILYDMLSKVTLDESGKYIIDSEKNIRLINNIKADLLTKIKRSGDERTIKEFIRGFEKYIKYQKDIIRKFGVDINEVNDYIKLEVIQKEVYEEMNSNRVNITREIKDLFDEAILGKRTFDNLVKAIDKKLGKYGHWSYSIAHTALNTFSQDILNTTAKLAGYQYYKYIGAHDSRNRGFCKDILEGRHPNTKKRHPNYWHISEINQLDNGQGLPVLRYRGGWGCRHRWYPVN